MTLSRQERAYRRHLRKEMDRMAENARQRLREAIAEGLIDGRIEEDGEIVIEADAAMLARLGAASHIPAVTTATTKPPMRIAAGAVLISPENVEASYDLAAAVVDAEPGLAVERGVLAAGAEHFRLLVRGGDTLKVMAP